MWSNPSSISLTLDNHGNAFDLIKTANYLHIESELACLRWTRAVEPELKFLVPTPASDIYFLAPAAEWFGPVKAENHCIICKTCLSQKICLWNRSPNFRSQIHCLKIFCPISVSSNPKLFGLRLHRLALNRFKKTQDCACQKLHAAIANILCLIFHANFGLQVYNVLCFTGWSAVAILAFKKWGGQTGANQNCGGGNTKTFDYTSVCCFYGAFVVLHKVQQRVFPSISRRKPVSICLWLLVNIAWRSA